MIDKTHYIHIENLELMFDQRYGVGTLCNETFEMSNDIRQTETCVHCMVNLLQLDPKKQKLYVAVRWAIDDIRYRDSPDALAVKVKVDEEVLSTIDNDTQVNLVMYDSQMNDIARRSYQAHNNLIDRLK